MIIMQLVIPTLTKKAKEEENLFEQEVKDKHEVTFKTFLNKKVKRETKNL